MTGRMIQQVVIDNEETITKLFSLFVYFVSCKHFLFFE